MTLDELKNEPKQEPVPERKLLTPGDVQRAKRRQSGKLRAGHLMIVESEDFPGRVEYKILTQDGSLIDPWDGHPDAFLGALGGE